MNQNDYDKFKPFVAFKNINQITWKFYEWRSKDNMINTMSVRHKCDGYFGLSNDPDVDIFWWVVHPSHVKQGYKWHKSSRLIEYEFEIIHGRIVR